MAAERAAMLPAFASFDARAAWALPLLMHPANLVDPTVQELLVRLGPAATPAVTVLRHLPSPQRETFAPLVERLLRASDAPPAQPFVSRPRVAAQHVPALLERLRAGPAASRWPALQALLATNDKAVVDAVWVLAELEFDAATFRQGTTLRAAVRCVYGARRLPGMQPLADVRGDDHLVEFRRVALAGALCHVQISSGNGKPDPNVQALQFLRDVQLRQMVANPPTGPSSLVAPEGSSPWLGNLRIALKRVAQVDGRSRAELAAAMLVPGAAAATVQSALHDLRGVDLSDAPDEFWQRLMAHASAEDRAAPGESKFASWYLSNLRFAPGSVPHGLVSRLVDLGMPDENADTHHLRRQLVDLVGGDALAAESRRIATTGGELAGWLTFLAGSNSNAARKCAQILGESFTQRVAPLPPMAQVAWFRIGGTKDLPAAVWAAVLGDPDVAVRRRAITAASRSAFERECPAATFGPSLRDEDDEVATQAAQLLGRNRKEPVAAVALLVDHCDGARPGVRAAIVRSLGWQKDHAAVAARQVVDAAFTADDWRVRLQASVVLLVFEPTHSAAWTTFAGYLDDARTEVVNQAWTEAGNRRELAERCVDLALARLERPGVVDSTIGYSIVRVLGAAPSARERTLPVLQDLVQRLPQSSAGQRATGAIESLQRAAK
jgi:hypothetical protein